MITKTTTTLVQPAQIALDKQFSYLKILEVGTLNVWALSCTGAVALANEELGSAHRDGIL